MGNGALEPKFACVQWEMIGAVASDKGLEHCVVLWTIICSAITSMDQ